MIRIAVDAMGGDRAPEVEVAGAVEAARTLKEKCEIVLIGDVPALERELKRHFFRKSLPITLKHADQTIGMDESPVQALRSKPRASINVAMRMHKEGDADCVISAGNSGAILGSAMLNLKAIPGVLRPAVGTYMPHESGSCFLIDVGTNVDCKPVQLLQFGIMGSLLVNHILEIDNPRVGLLNIGEEPGKGNEVSQRTFEMLSASNLNFIGNVEGRDIMRGKADVIVSDGFTGNIVLKFGESIGRMFSHTMLRHIRGNLRGNLGHFLIMPTLRKLLSLFDHQETGGAPLLGVRGTCIIAHGSSGPVAIRNAIRVGLQMVETGVSKHVETEIGKMQRI